MENTEMPYSGKVKRIAGLGVGGGIGSVVLFKFIMSLHSDFRAEIKKDFSDLYKKNSKEVSIVSEKVNGFEVRLLKVETKTESFKDDLNEIKDGMNEIKEELRYQRRKKYQK